MAAEIGKGSILICIKNEPPSYGYQKEYALAPLTVKAMYTVRMIFTHNHGHCPWDNCGHTGLFIEEKGFEGSKPGKVAYICYCPNLFRPLNDGDTSLVKDEKDKPEDNTFESFRTDCIPIKTPQKEPV